MDSKSDTEGLWYYEGMISTAFARFDIPMGGRFMDRLFHFLYCVCRYVND